MSPASSDKKPVGHLEVARAEQGVLIRVIGLGNMNISLTLKDFVKSDLEDDHTHFAIDLAQCSGMDSTFMGTIVGINFRVREKGGWLCLLNISDDNKRLLKMLGIWGLVPTRETFEVDAVETECLLPGGDAERRLQTIQKAHLHLVEIDERNRDRFGPFLKALEVEMGPEENGDKPASGAADDEASALEAYAASRDPQDLQGVDTKKAQRNTSSRIVKGQNLRDQVHKFSRNDKDKASDS